MSTELSVLEALPIGADFRVDDNAEPYIWRRVNTLEACRTRTPDGAAVTPLTLPLSRLTAWDVTYPITDTPATGERPDPEVQRLADQVAALQTSLRQAREQRDTATSDYDRFVRQVREQVIECTDDLEDFDNKNSFLSALDLDPLTSGGTFTMTIEVSVSAECNSRAASSVDTGFVEASIDESAIGYALDSAGFLDGDWNEGVSVTVSSVNVTDWEPNDS